MREQRAASFAAETFASGSPNRLAVIVSDAADVFGEGPVEPPVPNRSISHHNLFGLDSIVTASYGNLRMRQRLIQSLLHCHPAEEAGDRQYGHEQRAEGELRAWHGGYYCNISRMRAIQASISITPIAAPQRPRPNMWPTAAPINGMAAAPIGTSDVFASAQQPNANAAKAVATINRPKLN
jgi:hypothetical protein